MKKRLAYILVITMALSFALLATGCDMFDDDDDDYVVTESVKITEDQAVDIALAQVYGATRDDLFSIKLDGDDGRAIYEGEIYFEGMEYEFEIDAQTGDILQWEKDRE